jgi:lipopolysaccharide assembly protein B
VIAPAPTPHTMDFDLNWLLLALPAIFAMGWLASRLDLRQMRIENRHAPKAYFKGLNYLLNEQQDQAIDAFIEAVQNDPDTSELHFALGNLFRRRGEYERAVRVHEHLLSRGDLTQADRDRAQHALALDFLKAGLLDRAEASLSRLDGTRYEAQARLALLSIYERSRDWPQAGVIAAKLEAAGQGSFAATRAHYLCEQALASTDLEAGNALLRQAMEAAPESPRAGLTLAQRLAEQNAPDQAMTILQQLALRAPAAMPLIAQQLAPVAIATQQAPQVLAQLQSHYAQSPSLDLLHAIVGLESHLAPPSDNDNGPRDWYVKHLQREPSLVAAAHWIAGEKLEHEQFHPLVQRALDHAVKPLQRYRCAACGFEAQQHFWQCPGCQAWDSFPPRRVEEL